MKKTTKTKTKRSTAAKKPKDAKKSHLTLYIFIAIVAAIFTALQFPNFAMSLHTGGEIFLRLLKMMVVPLVCTSVMTGILGLGDVRLLGKPGAITVFYYLTTTVIAVVIGLCVVNVIQPGVGTVDPAALEQALKSQEAAELATKASGSDKPSITTIFKNLLLMLFTDNLFSSAANMNLLPLIVFSIIFAGMLTTMGRRVDTLRDIISQSNDALMSFILLLMRLAPIGIFCLVAARFGEAQAQGKFLQTIQQVGWYMIAVLIGLGIHAFVVLAGIFWLIKKKNPFRFISQMSEALLTAFSTASSSATLPITMRCAQKNAGIQKRSVEFVIPLGSTINMDGTALYEAAAAIFIAQAIGLELTVIQQVVIAVTATLAAIGAAGIPEAGLVTMVIVLNAVGLPVEYISLILSVDWLLDRFRTAVNAFGDSVGAAVVEGTFPKST